MRLLASLKHEFGVLKCRMNVHFWDVPDDFGRLFCERCGTRKPVHFEPIQTDEQRGREMRRPKTRGQMR